ncbi:testis-expressed protein 33 isoform X2 [Boleophthalmus pectinirostris]|uniref:testis-expressed protein 33 isoform X2 n=1 Tax=Boleophthalmus pectinirostris TaxID=150288 RepID=UPI00242B3EDF|nr:testis-expressed protein 33 isoform X2 [Boleophthalmus pectinirostris]
MPSLPHFSDTGSTSILANGYHSLGQCLRSNIFPGYPVVWKSVYSDSYVAHPLTTWPSNLWFGHKTDDLVQWTEMNIMNHKLKKNDRGDLQ